MVRKKRLDAGDGVHGPKNVANIGCGDKNELRRRFTLGEGGDWKAKIRQHLGVFVQRELGYLRRPIINDGAVGAISKLLDQLMLLRRGILAAELRLRLRANKSPAEAL